MDFGSPRSQRRKRLVWALFASCLAILATPILVVGLVTGSFIAAMFAGLGASLLFPVAAGVLAQIGARREGQQRATRPDA